MKVIWLRAANRNSNKLYRFFINVTYINMTSHSLMKIVNFWPVFLYCFLDCRSTQLLRLFSGHLPAMLFISMFSRERENEEKKKFCKRAKFLFTCRSFFNCSQTKFLAIIWVLSVFFYAIFGLPIFRLKHLTFRPQKRDKQVAPSGH